MYYNCFISLNTILSPHTYSESFKAPIGKQPDAYFNAPADKHSGEGFDAPPTLERSGSEHRRAVTSPPSEEEGLGVEVEPPLRVREDGWVFEKD